MKETRARKKNDGAGKTEQINICDLVGVEGRLKALSKSANSQVIKIESRLFFNYFKIASVTYVNNRIFSRLVPFFLTVATL